MVGKSYHEEFRASVKFCQGQWFLTKGLKPGREIRSLFVTEFPSYTKMFEFWQTSLDSSPIVLKTPAPHAGVLILITLKGLL